MQASKIFPETTYAILRGNERLVRFYVRAVVTRRVQKTGSPHDYKSTIEGVVVEPDRIDGEPYELILKPEQILGPFEEQQELRERQAAERTAAAQRTEKEQNDALALREKLYVVTGIARPENPVDWHQHFRTSHSNVDISRDGVAALLAALA